MFAVATKPMQFSETFEKTFKVIAFAYFPAKDKHYLRDEMKNFDIQNKT